MSVDNKKNYYEILKISPLASPFTIKKSYQKLARLYHPDKNPNNPEAAETFKQINEAYQILSDSFKRKDFDRQREQEKKKEEQKKQKEAFSPLYESYHSYAPFIATPSASPYSATYPKKEPTSSQPQPPFPEKKTSYTPPSTDKKKDNAFSIKGLKTYFTKTNKLSSDQIHGQIEVSLEEAALGCKKTISLKNAQKETFLVHIPPGTKENQSIKIHNQKNKSKEDIYVSIIYKKHPLFTLEKENILMNLPIPFTKAVLGGEVEIPTLGGRVSFQLPAGTHGGDVIQLKGQGFPSSDSYKKKRGHMLISVLIDIPIHFSEEE
ncbi:MAG: DnaJ domain-containing protein, partial [Bdellovibrionaceae bacterium]|nr:DnaJ domain-containing protein [Pseudobdellovibrionaceae bacterium]